MKIVSLLKPKRAKSENDDGIILRILDKTQAPI